MLAAAGLLHGKCAGDACRIAYSGWDFMGLFTSFAENAFPAAQMAPASAGASFDLPAARALAWAAQLAYETADEAKFSRILARWGWSLETIVAGDFNSVLPIATTNGFVVRAGDATVIAFAGTEPENLLQWVRNFTFGAGEGVHEGFEAGVEAVWAEQLRPHIAAATSLCFAGHSLGAALSAVTAARLCREMPEAAAKLRAVYALGMPRVFTGPSAQAYNDTRLAPDATLGERTFRLIHGADIVPHVPPAIGRLDYRHVGRAVSSPRGGRFDPQALQPPGAEPGDGNSPLSIKSLLGGGPDSGNGEMPPFPADHAGVALVIDTLPRAVRDHLMDGYLRALGALENAPEAR